MIADALETRRDHLPHTRWRVQLLRRGLGFTAMESHDRFYDHERVAFADAPDPFPDSLNQRFFASGSDQGAYQRHRLGQGQGTQRRGEEPRLPAELGHRATKKGRVQHLFDTNGAEDQHGPVGYATAEENHEPEGHLVRPMKVLENNQQSAWRRQVLYRPRDRFEEPHVVFGRGWLALRPAELGKQSRSEEHTSELQSLAYLVCRLLLEKKKKDNSSQGFTLLSADSTASPPNQPRSLLNRAID